MSHDTNEEKKCQCLDDNKLTQAICPLHGKQPISTPPSEDQIDCNPCDFKNAKRYGRADYRCPNCGKQLMLEMVLMTEAGIDYKEITPDITH